MWRLIWTPKAQLPERDKWDASRIRSYVLAVLLLGCSVRAFADYRQAGWVATGVLCLFLGLFFIWFGRES
jgi:hypothetical protein